jgi:hypothetical protein
MERLEHFRGRLLDGEEHVVLDPVDGYVGCHQLPGGRKTWYGNFDLTTEQHNQVSTSERYRLVLGDGRSGDIFLDIHPSNVDGHDTAEFQIIGGLKDKKCLPR